MRLRLQGSVIAHAANRKSLGEALRNRVHVTGAGDVPASSCIPQSNDPLAAEYRLLQGWRVALTFAAITPAGQGAVAFQSAGVVTASRYLGPKHGDEVNLRLQVHDEGMDLGAGVHVRHAWFALGGPAVRDHPWALGSQRHRLSGRTHRDRPTHLFLVVTVRK